jgi:ABC-type transport system involved in multi-copper enzyme maturation permease subunit
MIALVRSEVRKLRSTQVWFWLLLASVALTALSVVGQIAGASSTADLSDHVHDTLSAANAGYIAVFVLGVLSVTTEFRYQTITPTVLATPSRWRLIGAKLITFTLVGVAFALACVVVELAVALPWLSARGVNVTFHDSYTAVLAVFTVVALLSLVGLGAGALLRNQIVAIVVGLLFLLLIDNLILIIPWVKFAYPFLPGGLIAAIITQVSAERVTNNVTLLPVWGGVVGLVVWALGTALIGASITMNRDIT